jgi:hypothetical protein
MVTSITIVAQRTSAPEDLGDRRGICHMDLAVRLNPESG